MIAEAPQHGSARPNSKSGSWVPLIWVCSAAACFHLAYWSAGLAPLVLIYLFCLIQLAQVPTGRQAFYFGAVVGLLTIAPQLVCFWTIFGVPAIALWCVLAFWLGLFVALARLALLRFGPVRGAFMLPVLWTGLE